MTHCVQNLSEKLRFADHHTLNDLANYLEEQARIIRERSALNAVMDNEAITAGIDYLVASPRIVRRKLRQGERLNDALTQTADEMNVPVGSVKRSWHRFLADKNRYELQRRNTLIIELAALGKTNAEIGRMVNLHAHSVSRIISKARKAYRQGRKATQMNLIMSGGY